MLAVAWCCFSRRWRARCSACRSRESGRSASRFCSARLSSGRHAARRRLRVRHALYGRRRQHADDRDAGVLSRDRRSRPRTCRSGARCPSLSPVRWSRRSGGLPALALNRAVRGDRGGDGRRGEAAARRLVSGIRSRRMRRRCLHGPWPLVGGAVALAGNFATLALSGRPWGSRPRFALWGAKAAARLGSTSRMAVIG